MFKISSLVVQLFFIQYRFWLFLLKAARMASSKNGFLRDAWVFWLFCFGFFFNCDVHAVLHMHCHCPTMHKLENILGFIMAM